MNKKVESVKKLRVWWIRNVPGTPTYYPVKDVKGAIKVIQRLTKKDLENENIVSNASGLEVFEDGVWGEYYDEEGRDIDQIIEEAEA